MNACTIATAFANVLIDGAIGTDMPDYRQQYLDQLFGADASRSGQAAVRFRYAQGFR
jgi:hypothetical protein